MQTEKQQFTRASLIITLICLMNPVYASDIYELDPIVVTATRTPVEAFKANANISIVTRDDIETNHYTNLQDALRNVPGVTISGYGNTGEVYSSNSLILNGTDKVIVLIDGVRANINGSAGTAGKMATAEISNMDSIERIEVLKSSASTLYGADAAGGVINIITRKPTDAGLRTKLSIIKGSFKKEQYNLSHQGEKNGLYWDIFAQKKLAGDFKDGWNRTIPEYLNSINNMYTIGKRFGDTADIQITYQTYQSDYHRPTGGWSTIEKERKLNHYAVGKKDNNKLNIAYTQTVNDRLYNQLAFYQYHHRADETSWKSNKGKSYSTVPYTYHYSTVGISEQITYRPNETHTFVGGGEWYKDKVDNYRTSYDPNTKSNYRKKETTTYALFLNDEIRFAETWNISLGIRFNHDSKYGQNSLPSIVLGNTPTDKLNYYISYKKFFVAPYPSQLYGTYGNPSLNAESGKAIEIGFNYRFHPTLTGALHFFHRDMNDTISYDAGLSNPYTNSDGMYSNTGSEQGNGFDIQLRKSFSPHFSSSIAYTYTHIRPTAPNKNSNSDGRIPAGVWNMAFNYTEENWNAGLYVLGNIGKAGAKAQPVNHSAAADKYHTYWIFNAVFNYKPSNKINLFMKCNNIFNRLYTEQRQILDPNGAWYSAPGRYFEVGMEYIF